MYTFNLRSDYKIDLKCYFMHTGTLYSCQKKKNNGDKLYRFVCLAINYYRINSYVILTHFSYLSDAYLSKYPVPLRDQCIFNPRTAANKAKKKPARSVVLLSSNNPPIIVGISATNFNLYAINNPVIILPIFFICLFFLSNGLSENYTRNGLYISITIK